MLIELGKNPHGTYYEIPAADQETLLRQERLREYRLLLAQTGQLSLPFAKEDLQCE
jgi:hypothetical protein